MQQKMSEGGRGEQASCSLNFEERLGGKGSESVSKNRAAGLELQKTVMASETKPPAETFH